MAPPTSGRAFVLLLAFLFLAASLALMVIDPGSRKPEPLGPFPVGDGDAVVVAPRAAP